MTQLIRLSEGDTIVNSIEVGGGSSGSPEKDNLGVVLADDDRKVPVESDIIAVPANNAIMANKDMIVLVPAKGNLVV